jgi:tetratricopeptide (TPR) repeat protein
MSDASVQALVNQARQEEAAGRLESARELLEKALAGDPGNENLRFACAALAAKVGRTEDAIVEFERVLGRDPGNLRVLTWLSGLYRKADRAEDAIAAHERIVALSPRDVGALNALAQVLLECGRLQSAASAFKRAVAVQSQAASHFGLSVVFWQLKDGDRAIEELRAGIGLEPSNLNARNALLDYLLYAHRYEEVLTASQDLMNVEPKSTKAREAYGQALHALGRFEELDRYLQDWLSREANCSTALNFSGNVNLEKGDFESARADFQKALRSEPDRGGAYFGAVQSGCAWPPNAPEVLKMLQLAERTDLPPQDRNQLQLALGAIFEAHEQYETSMSHYDRANQIVLPLIESTIPFDVRVPGRLLENCEKLFTSEFLRTQRENGDPSELPVFVFGMIRSGTTLTEQVLASHPRVSGAGEQFFWSDREDLIVDWLRQAPTKDRIQKTANAYLDLLRTHGPDSGRIVDKLPGNFFLAGLIHTHFPNARLIHVRRHPVDTSLSIWSTHYQSPPNFSASRGNIVLMYRIYQRVMEHYRRVLPPDRFLEIDYEELVSAREPTIRKLLAFCGLEWSESCLHPELRVGRVSTPSLARVRKPIDTARIGRWKSFEPWLGEFSQLLA